MENGGREAAVVQVQLRRLGGEAARCARSRRQAALRAVFFAGRRALTTSFRTTPERFALALRVVVFFAAGLRAAGFFAVAVRFVAVVRFVAAALRVVVFFAAGFFAAVFFAGAFFAGAFFAAGFLAIAAIRFVEVFAAISRLLFSSRC